MRRWVISFGVTLSFLLAAASVLGELATEQEAANVARNWVTEMTWKKGTWAGAANPAITGEHELSMDGMLLARYYDVSPRGYIVVPVLKELGPIRAYSEESNLDATQEGGMIQLLKDVLKDRTELYLEVYGDLNASQPSSGKVPFDRSDKTRWARLEIPAKEFRADESLSIDAEAGPLLTSSWGQYAPYNNDCPLSEGERSVVGCTATALSQILNYYKWPPRGLGSHSYYWDGDWCSSDPVPQVLSADFSDPYDWDNMADSCDGAEGCTAEQEAALAELCYEVGVSLDMEYSPCGSSASPDPEVLANYFVYDTSATTVYRMDHTRQSWFDLIRSEVDSGRVMWYLIGVQNTSHLIVCDGYRENGDQLEYHVNYGWRGTGNSWFVVDNLICPWIPGGTICDYNEEFLIHNIKPNRNPIVSLIGTSQNITGGDGDSSIEPGETVHLTVTVRNDGNPGTPMTGSLSTTDPYVQITSATTQFNSFYGWGEISESLTPFTIVISPACPDRHTAKLSLHVWADGTNVKNSNFLLYVGPPGFSDNMENSAFWTHTPTQPGYYDQWHVEICQFHSPSRSWKAGGPCAASYADGSYAGLISPPILLPSKSQLRFWHKIGAHRATVTEALDGGIVMITGGDGVWTQIFPEGGYPCTIVANTTGPFAPGTPCYSGTKDWCEAIFDLSAYSGFVQFIFCFGSDESVNRTGWWIDDVSVTGELCCNGRVGDVNDEGGDEPTISDISVLIDAKFITGTCEGVIECQAEADVNQSGGDYPTCADVTISDISMLIDYLFITGPETATLLECL